MSKVLESQSKRFTGSVVIADPLTIPQAQLIEAGMKAPKEESTDGRVWLSVVDANQLPAVLACVEKWELVGVPEKPTLETFPASPRAESHKLVDWLFRELLTVYFGEAEVPNE